MPNWWESDEPVAVENQPAANANEWWKGDAPITSRDDALQAIDSAAAISEARQQLSNSPLPNVHAGLAGAVGDLYGIGGHVAGALGVPGASDFADAAHHAADAVEQAANEQSAQGTQYPIIPQAFRGAVRTFPQMIMTGRLGGPFAAIAAAAATEYSQALTEGKDAGLSGSHLHAYAASHAAIEGGVASAFQRVGLGGAESAAAGKFVKNGIRAALKQAGVQTIQELPEELLTELGHSAARAIAGTDPEALSGPAIANTAAQTTLQTLMTMGMVEAPHIAASLAPNQPQSPSQDPELQAKLDAVQAEYTKNQRELAANRAQNAANRQYAPSDELYPPGEKQRRREAAGSGNLPHSTEQDSAAAGDVVPSASTETGQLDRTAAEQPQREPEPVVSTNIAGQLGQLSDQQLGHQLAHLDEQLDTLDPTDPQYAAPDIRRQLVNNEIKRRTGRDAFSRDAATDSGKLPQQQQEPSNATPNGIEPGNGQQQHPGVAPGPDLRPDEATARQAEGGQTGGGDRTVEGAGAATEEANGRQKTQVETGGLPQPPTVRDYGTIAAPNRVALGEHFGERLTGGAAYASINDARKEASELLGEDVRPGTPAAKHVDEAVEQGVVRAARQIIAENQQPYTAFDDLVDLYNRQPNLSTRTSTSMQQQAYSTPAPLAYLASGLAGINTKTTVLEPTAGNGMLLIAANPKNVTANELNPDRLAALQTLGFNASGVDAATERLRHAGYPVDAVIANPPFGKVQDANGQEKTWTIDGMTTNQVDHAIVLNSLQSMKPDGRAVLIIGAKGGRETDPVRRARAYSGAGKRFYDKLYDEYNVTDHFTVDGDLYERQGAGFPVDVIVIDGKAGANGSQSRPRPWNVKAGGVPVGYHSWEDLKRDKLHSNATAIEAASEAATRVEPVGGGSRSASEPRREGTDVGRVPAAAGGPGAATQPGQPQPAEGIREPVVGPNGSGPVAKRPGKARPERSVRGDAGERPQPASERLPGAGESGQGNRRGNADVRSSDVAGGSAAESGIGVEEQSKPAADSGKLQQPKKAQRENASSENEFQVPYKPKSSLEHLDTLLPKNHVDAVSRALDAVAEEYGDIDKFVAKELGIPAKSLKDRFSAEQLDAVALAIANHKKGEAFILGDQTGVGKGRVAAAMMHYAKQNDMLPVFVTEKPDLYGDMVRDLTDIGVSTPAKPVQSAGDERSDGREKGASAGRPRAIAG
jgi:hypothetical protein